MHDCRQTCSGGYWQDNVALIAVLEALDKSEKNASPGRRQLICVANTHIHANPELSDVKLWQARRLSDAMLRLCIGVHANTWLPACLGLQPCA